MIPTALRALLVSVPLLLASVSAWSADGRILEFYGDVRVNGEPVSPGTQLNSGDTISTGADGEVTIVLADNSVLDLDVNSHIRLSDYVYDVDNPDDNNSDIGVVEGSLRYVSGLIAKEDAEDVSFNAGNSTIGVRGSYTSIEVGGTAVNVEAMVGKAVVIVENENCPPTPVLVPTGKAILVDPITCEIVLVDSTMEDAVNNVVQLIASLDPDDPESAKIIADQLSELSEHEQVLVIAVLINNAEHLEINSDIVANTILIIAQESPDSITAVVTVAAVLDPDNEDLFEQAARRGAPNEGDSVLEGEQSAEEIREELGRDDGPGQDIDDADEPGGDGSSNDQGAGNEVPENDETEPPGGGEITPPSPPSGGTEVPPGGGPMPSPPSPE